MTETNLIEHRLAELGLELPTLPEYTQAFLPGVIAGDILFMSAQAWTRDGTPVVRGAVGGEVSVEEAIEAARRCTLNGLAAAKLMLGSLDRIARVIRVVGYVASAPGFQKQPMVVGGASNLLAEIFGEAGRHARSSLGVSELGGGASVLIELTLLKK